MPATTVRIKLYRIWSQRLYRKHLSKEWMDFEPFYKWALSNGYKSGLCLIRTNENELYSPDNCYFGTRKECATHRANARVIEFNGKRNTIAGWARELGIYEQTLYKRLDGGWGIKKALTTAPNGRGRRSYEKSD